MKLTALDIDGVWLAESSIWKDDRGFFREWFKSEDVKAATGREFGVEQANISLSSAGTMRGIHYSIAPRGQAKWITCISGSIQDVIVDIRRESKTFGQWIDIDLKGDSGKAVLISEGLGHGFLALEDNTAVAYLVSTAFSASEEYEINPLDEKLRIRWQMKESDFRISEKDKNAPDFVTRLRQDQLPS